MALLDLDFHSLRSNPARAGSSSPSRLSLPSGSCIARAAGSHHRGCSISSSPSAPSEQHFSAFYSQTLTLCSVTSAPKSKLGCASNLSGIFPYLCSSHLICSPPCWRFIPCYPNGVFGHLKALLLLSDVLLMATGGETLSAHAAFSLEEQGCAAEPPSQVYGRQKLELKPFHKLQFIQDLAFLRQELNAGVTFPFFSRCLTCQKKWNFRNHLIHSTIQTPSEPPKTLPQLFTCTYSTKLTPQYIRNGFIPASTNPWSVQGS